MTQTPSQNAHKEESRLAALGRALRHILLNNWGTKLLALVLAIGLWAGLITQDPTLTREKNFANVSVNITGSDSLKRNGYIVVSDLDEVLQDVDISVDVPQMQYASAAASNYNVRIDLSRLTAAGVHEAKILSTNTSTYGTVTSISPATVQVEVDEYITRYRIPVSAATVGNAPEGYYATVPSVDPPMIAVSGPKSLVEKIVRAEAVVELGNLPEREGEVRKAIPFTLLDENSNSIESELLEVTSEGVLMESVVVEQSVYSLRTIDMTDMGLIRGTPATGYEVKNVYVTPSTITIAGYKDEIEALDVLYADSTVNVEGLKESVNKSIRIRQPSAIKYANTSTITVAVEIGPVMRSKTYDSIRLDVTNVESGLTASLGTKYGSVTITGAQLWLNTLYSRSVDLYVDATGLTEGVYDLPLLCTVRNADGQDYSVDVAPMMVRVTITAKE
ncbi:MAG: hypothetical protein IJ438_05335 [Clostridia bacterium]|nr:hypothetical protein [Clostridia bacterium]